MEGSLGPEPAQDQSQAVPQHGAGLARTLPRAAGVGELGWGQGWGGEEIRGVSATGAGLRGPGCPISQETRDRIPMGSPHGQGPHGQGPHGTGSPSGT